MIIETKSLSVCIDEAGSTVSITDKEDSYGANYILPDMGWGMAAGFVPDRVDMVDDTVTVSSVHAREKLRLTVVKSASDGCYTESYTLTNEGRTDYYVTRENFGLHFPMNHSYQRDCDFWNQRCISHIWCGENCTWIRSQKPSGEGKILWMTLTEGSVADYSILYPASQPIFQYRGVFVLHPADMVLLPGKSMTLTFAFACSREEMPTSRLQLYADKYTVFPGERMHWYARYAGEMTDAVVYTDDNVPLTYTSTEDGIMGDISFAALGEKCIRIVVRGESTFLKCQVIRPIEEILCTRAAFIGANQQHSQPDSSLDGAYLIYDRETEKQYYSSRFGDSNACRERLSMGVVVACALQEKFDADLFASLQKHRAFIEREVFDTETATVYNEVGRNNDWERLYNYPWVSVYYYEWYRLTGEKQCLYYAAAILLRYYTVLNGAKQESVCMETYRILEALDREGESDLYSRLKDVFLHHGDAILARAGNTISQEVTCANGMVSAMVEYLSQAYLLTGAEKYRCGASQIYPRAAVFLGNQPDYHLYQTAVRYWDGYWFGKMKTYGDTFPQWLSVLSGLMYYWYGKAFGTDTSHMVTENLKGSLCLFAENGFASSCYLYPCRVEMEPNNRYTSSQGYVSGIHIGKRYDAWANDQDWALYYAWTLLRRDTEKI